MIYFTKQTRFKKLQKQALLIDTDLKNYLHEHDLKRFERKPNDQTKVAIESVVKNIIPEAEFLGQGWDKIAFKVFNKKRILVLKVLKNPAGMEACLRPYISIQENRNKLYLKHYFASECCVLQKLGIPVDSSLYKKKISLLRKKLFLHSDLKRTNMCLDGKTVKAIDAILSKARALKLIA